jgi:hypothetical protein
MFTADDSRRGTRGQLVGGTVEVQVTDDLLKFSARSAWVGRCWVAKAVLNQFRRGNGEESRIFTTEGAENREKRYVDRAGMPDGSLARSRRTSFTSWTMTMATANQMQ